MLRDYSTALVRGEKDTVLSAVGDDVEWEIVGRQVVRGKADFAAALDAAVEQQVATLHLDSIITHGDEAAVSSTMEFSEGRRSRRCDVYEFSGHGKTAKIKRITSYWIEG